MRILHLTRDYPPRHCGGISTAVGGLVTALRKAGIACAVASFDEYRPASRRGSRPSRSGAGDATAGAAPPGSASPGHDAELLRIDHENDLERLPEFVRGFAPDRIQLHADLLWDVAESLRDRLGVPLLATLHVCHRQMLRILEADRPSASLAAQERALRHADAIVAPTHAAADAIVEDYPDTAGRMHVAGFTVDSRAPVSLAEPRLVTVGRFGAVKGTDRLIDLLPHLLANPFVEVDVIGGLPRSPRRDRRWRRRIEEAAGVHADRVHLHGWLDPDARDAVLAQARALLSVSRIETFGLAALEALAMGVPVCGYAAPALIETAPRQHWVAEEDPSLVAAGILELLSVPERCRDMGRSGRAAVPSWKSLVARWRTVYETAC